MSRDHEHWDEICRESLEKIAFAQETRTPVSSVIKEQSSMNFLMIGIILLIIKESNIFLKVLRI